jgi:hypothetical protein
MKMGMLQDNKNGSLNFWLFSDMLMIGKQDVKKKILKSLHISDVQVIAPPYE